VGRPPRRFVVRAVVGAAASFALAAGTTLPVSAGSPAGYTVPDGVEVMEVVVRGARGGNTAFGDFVALGGGGCAVLASLEVASGDAVSWILGTPGGDTNSSTAASPGGVGGAGARPGGTGGATADTFDRSAKPGAGGGGASSLSVNGSELIVAAGGGGAGQNGTSAACSNSPQGENGFGSVPTAGGGKTPDAGGIGGLGNAGSATPPPGSAGNSASDSPPGKGGDGGNGNFGGPGGGGGGGGISGGGGGAGQNGQFGGGNGSGAGGLSGAPEPGAGVSAPRYAGAPAGPGEVAGLAVVIDTTELPDGKAGTPFSAFLNADFEVVFEQVILDPLSADAAPTQVSVTWSLAEGSAPLPDGLSIDPAGSITGTPIGGGTTEFTLAASVIDDFDNTRARSVVTFTLDIAQADPTTTTTADPTTTSTSEATTTTATGGGGGSSSGGSGTLPATGAAGVAPLVAAGAMLVGSGTAAALLARRRRAS